MSEAMIKSDQEIAVMREGGRMLATVLNLLRDKTTAGATPKDMARLADKELRALGGTPSFLGFLGYPDVICVSVNDQVQHSIPTEIPFKQGDIVNYDFGVTYAGMITDAGLSVCVDEKLTSDTKRLLQGTERALYDGLQVIKAGTRVGDVSAAIEQTLRKYKLGIVRELVGHGVGHELHEEPEIPNYGNRGHGPVLRAGMTIAVEPITTLGGAGIYEARDGWTLLTRDGSWSAQFEHTVVVTPAGFEILTTL